MTETGIIEVFARCTTCGASGRQIRVIKDWAEKNNKLIIVNKVGTNRNIEANAKHLEYLSKAGMPLSHHVAIVVTNTNKIERLREWKAS